MDAFCFLKSRTDFIRFFYREGATGFARIKDSVENELPPFDNPPYSEDGEPAYLGEWMDAGAATDLLGIACISLLSDTLKLYFNALETRTIGFKFENGKAAFKCGFVPAYFAKLGEILDTDWNDCPADRDLIEQVVLARNVGQHATDLTSFSVTHNQAMLDKHPRPFFVSDIDLTILDAGEGSLLSFLMPTLHVSAAQLEAAIVEVEKLAQWIEERLDRLWYGE